MPTLVLKTPEHPVCDFCSYPVIYTIFNAHDMELGKELSDDYREQTGEDLRLVSRGEWHSCKECAALVEAGDWESLALKATKAYVCMAPDADQHFQELYNVILKDYKILKNMIRRSS